MRKEKRIDFLGCMEESVWFNKTNNTYFNILNKKYNVIIDTKKPDYLFLGPYLFTNIYAQDKFLNSKIRIFLTYEAIVPDFNCVDYAISKFDNIILEDRCLKVLHNNISYLSNNIKQEDGVKILNEKTMFCNFIYSHGEIRERKKIFKTLSTYKKVNSLGNYLNNTKIDNEMGQNGNWLKSSIELKKPYKFSIAFENASHVGYTTEKIVTSFLANTIPIYWGDTKIDRYINSKSFINCHDYPSFDEVLKRVKEIDNSDDLYTEILNQKRLTELGQKEVEERDSKLENFLYQIFSQEIDQARRRGRGLWNSMNEKQISNTMQEYKWIKYGIISRKEKLLIPLREFSKKIGLYWIITIPKRLLNVFK